MSESVGYVTMDVIPMLKPGGAAAVQRQLATSLSRASGVAVAGEKVGAQYGSAFAKTATAEGAAATSGIFADAEKGAVVAGLGMGHRFGMALSSTVGEYAKTIGSTVLGFFAFEKASEFLHSVVDEGEQAQQTAQLLQAHLKSTGGVAGVTADDIEKLAVSQSHLVGVDQDTIEQGAALLLTFQNVRNEAGKGNDIFDRTVVTAENLSASLGNVGLSGALRLVGRAVNDPISGLTLLTRYGIAFTDQQKTQIATLLESGKTLQAQKLVLDQLGQRFGGAAQAADTPLKQLHADWQDFEQNLGTKAIPLANNAASGLVSLGGAAGDLAHLIGEVPAPLRDTAAALLAVKAASGLGLFRTIESGWVMARVRVSEYGDALKSANSRMLLARSGALALGVGLEILATHVGNDDKQLSDLVSTVGDVATGFAVGGPIGAGIGASIGLFTSFQHELDAINKTAEDALKISRQHPFDFSGNIEADQRAIVRLNEAAGTDTGFSSWVRAIPVAGGGISWLADRFKKNDVGGQVDKINQSMQRSEQLRVGYATFLTQLGKNQGPEVFAENLAHVGSRIPVLLNDLHQFGFSTADINKAMLNQRGWGAMIEALHQQHPELLSADDVTKLLTHDTNRLTQAEQSYNNVLAQRLGGQIALTQAIAQAEQETKHAKNTLDVSTVAGANNMQVLLGIASAAKSVTGNTQIQSAAISKARGEIVKLAMADGDSHQQAIALAYSLLRVRGAAEQAAEEAHQLAYQIDHLHDKTIRIRIEQSGSTTVASGIGQFRALGGPIYGGIPGRDSVPVLAMPGEHMWTKPEVDAAGGHQAMYALRRAIRSGKRLAGGGPVDEPLLRVTSATAGTDRAILRELRRMSKRLDLLQARLDRQVHTIVDNADDVARGVRGVAAGAVTARADLNRRLAEVDGSGN